MCWSRRLVARGTPAPTRRLLIFEFEGRLIGPELPGARAGDPWHGPHVGINYTLTADGKDVYYKRTVRKAVERKERPSSDAERPSSPGWLGPSSSKAEGCTSTRHGRCSRLLPLQQASPNVYLGTIAAQDWFPAPETAA